MEPEEGRFATFGLGLIPPRGPQAPYKEVRFTRPRELCTTEVVKLAAGTDSITTSLAVWPEPERGLHIWGLITSESQAVGSAPLHGHPTFLLHAPFLVVRARAPGVLYVTTGGSCTSSTSEGLPTFFCHLDGYRKDPARRRHTSATSGCERAQPNRDQNFASRTRGNAVADGLRETEVSTDLLDIWQQLLHSAQPCPSGRRSRPYRQISQL